MTVQMLQLLLLLLQLILFSSLLPPVLGGSVPVEVTIGSRKTECLYDEIEKGESLTFSVFIVQGAELKGEMVLEGPIAGFDDIASGRHLVQASQKISAAPQRITQTVDFEHLRPSEVMKEFQYDDDDDMAGLDDDADDDHDEVRARQREEKRRQHVQLARKKAMERRKRMLETNMNLDIEGKPAEITLRAKQDGWYRACLRASGWYEVTAEIDLRKESELDGVDPRTGHVHTWEKFYQREEEDYLAQDSAEKELGVTSDFEQTKNYMTKLRRLFSDIQTKQQSERHRLMVHEITNEHSHSRMVLTSLMETMIYMLVTGFQIYTIRKWFSTGTPQLPTTGRSNGNK